MWADYRLAIGIYGIREGNCIVSWGDRGYYGLLEYYYLGGMGIWVKGIYLLVASYILIFAGMKANINKYPVVDSLPVNAMTVASYAQENNFTTSYIYKLIKLGKNNFQIVVFQGINFIIP